MNHRIRCRPRPSTAPDRRGCAPTADAMRAPAFRAAARARWARRCSAAAGRSSRFRPSWRGFSRLPRGGRRVASGRAIDAAATSPPPRLAMRVAKWTSTARRTLSRHLLAAFARIEEVGVALVRDIAGLEQDRRHVGRLQHQQRRHAMEARLGRHQRLGLAAEQSREAGRRVHRLALRQVDQDRRDVGACVGQVHAGDDVGLVLARRQPCGLLVGGDFGQGIDGRAARVVVARAVAVDRDEQRRAHPPRDLEAFAVDQIAVVVAGQHDARTARRRPVRRGSPWRPSASVLFLQLAVGRDRAGIVPAVPGVDHHQRPVGVALRRAAAAAPWRRREPASPRCSSGRLAART